jgi:prepilin-type N-terminal cleavage/methylation domain-containing protein
MTPWEKRAMKNRNRHGFSMIEVMVAATILVVIVMMLGMLFQQTSVAWRTGLMRSDGYMQLRAFIGALQRDASAMIDANQIPQSLLCNNQKQKFESGEIRFYTMTGTLRTKPNGYAGGLPCPELHHIPNWWQADPTAAGAGWNMERGRILQRSVTAEHRRKPR